MRTDRTRLLLAFVLMAMSAPTASRAQSFSTSRGAAVGAFSAVGNGISALYWNPAGLSGLSGWQFHFTSGLPADAGSSGGVTLQALAAARMFPGGHALGASVSPEHGVEFLVPSTLTLLDADGSPITTRYDRSIRYTQAGNVGYAYRLPGRASLGMAVRMFSTSVSDTRYALDSAGSFRASSRDASSGLWTVTIGGRIDLSPGWSVAADVTNLVSIEGSRLPEEFASHELDLERVATLGAAWRPAGDLTLSSDIDTRENLRAGMEWVPVEWGSVRAGVYARDLPALSLEAGAAGIGLRFPPLDLDLSYIAFASSPQRSHRIAAQDLAGAVFTQLDLTPFTTDRLLLTATLSLSPFRDVLARIEYVEVLGEVFPSSAHTYAYRPVGKARVRNVSGKPIDARVSFYVEDLMSGPTESRPIRIAPNDLAEMPFYAVFSEELHAITDLSVYDGTVFVKAEVAPDYDDRYQTRVLVRGRNDWDGDVLSLRSFVTASDPAVVAFSRDALYRHRAAVADTPAELSPVAKARVIFEELGKRITYVRDPKTDRDRVQYPSETLSLRGGDCDDMAVVYSSLLLSVGIGTAFVDVIPPDAPGEGHIYVLFDTGIPANEASSLTANPKRYVLRENDRRESTVWIPVETTVAGGDFDEAWSAGAERYFRDAEVGLGIVRGWMRVADITTQY